MMHTAVGKTAVCHAAHRRPSPTRRLTPPPATTVVAVLCTAISSRCFAMRYNRCLRHATPSTTSFVAVQCHQCQLPTLYFAVSGHHLRVDVQHRHQPLPTTFAVRSRRRWPLPSPCNAIGDHLRRRALPSAPAALAALPSAAVALAMMHTAIGSMQPHRRCRPRDAVHRRQRPPSPPCRAPCTVRPSPPRRCTPLATTAVPAVHRHERPPTFAKVYTAGSNRCLPSHL
jgi:hypothetical protein